jgi:hypothetical protein
MFVVPRPNVIKSDEGFSVEVLGMTGLLYTEGPKSLRLDSEVLAGPHGLMIYSSSIRVWNAPHAGEIIDEARRDAIVENIRRAFRFRGFEIEVI